MPVVVLLTLYINRTRLPAEFRPGPVWSLIMVGVGLFYGFYAGFFFYDLFRGGIDGGNAGRE